MSIAIRPAQERGHFNHGWLDTAHSFSFGDYYDPSHMGYRDLRVINEDVIEGGAGFPTHGHQNMEIVTYMLQGALAHRDSTGGEGVIKRGDVQAMSAGTGVRHSEFNDSARDPARLLQIWIMPSKNGFAPGYRQSFFADETKRNQLKLLVSRDGHDGSLPINQDTAVYAALLDEGRNVSHTLGTGRGAWIQLAEGEITVNGQRLKMGDGAAIDNESAIEIRAVTPSEFLLFDLR